MASADICLDSNYGALVFLLGILFSVLTALLGACLGPFRSSEVHNFVFHFFSYLSIWIAINGVGTSFEGLVNVMLVAVPLITFRAALLWVSTSKTLYLAAPHPYAFYQPKKNETKEEFLEWCENSRVARRRRVGGLTGVAYVKQWLFALGRANLITLWTLPIILLPVTVILLIRVFVISAVSMEGEVCKNFIFWFPLLGSLDFLDEIEASFSSLPSFPIVLSLTEIGIDIVLSAVKVWAFMNTGALNLVITRTSPFTLIKKRAGVVFGLVKKIPVLLVLLPIALAKRRMVSLKRMLTRNPDIPLPELPGIEDVDDEFSTHYLGSCEFLSWFFLPNPRERSPVWCCYPYFGLMDPIFMLMARTRDPPLKVAVVQAHQAQDAVTHAGAPGVRKMEMKEDRVVWEQTPTTLKEYMSTGHMGGFKEWPCLMGQADVQLGIMRNAMRSIAKGDDWAPRPSFWEMISTVYSWVYLQCFTLLPLHVSNVVFSVLLIYQVVIIGLLSGGIFVVVGILVVIFLIIRGTAPDVSKRMISLSYELSKDPGSLQNRLILSVIEIAVVFLSGNLVFTMLVLILTPFMSPFSPENAFSGKNEGIVSLVYDFYIFSSKVMFGDFRYERDIVESEDEEDVEPEAIVVAPVEEPRGNNGIPPSILGAIGARFGMAKGYEGPSQSLADIARMKIKARRSAHRMRRQRREEAGEEPTRTDIFVDALFGACVCDAEMPQETLDKAAHGGKKDTNNV